MNKTKSNKNAKKKMFATVVLSFALVTASASAVGTAGGFVTPLSVWREVDWEAVDGEIDTVQSQTKVIDVGTGAEMEVPTETLRKLAGKNVTLAMHASDGVAVSAFGRDVATASQDLKITLTDEDDMIPENVSRKVLYDALYSKMFAMEEKVDYGIRLNIHFNLGRDYAGKYANLYHFDEETENMVYDSSFIVTTGGMAMFSLERGDEYILTVTEGLLNGGRTEYTVEAGDNLTRIAEKTGINLQTLIAVNPSIEDADKIYPGQVLAIVKQ